jgi:hypothetical protein
VAGDVCLNCLENFLGFEKTPVSFAEKWAANPPAEAQGISLAEYTVKGTLHLARLVST